MRVYASGRGLSSFYRCIFSGSGVSISHLQYADDTLLFVEAIVFNLLAMKTLLWTFELASGLRVNFSKSSLPSVNLSDDLLAIGAGFLICKRQSLPFKYIRLSWDQPL